MREWVCLRVCAICTCESWGLSISMADSSHLAEGFGDSHCLYRALTLILAPGLRCLLQFSAHLLPSHHKRHSDMDERWQMGCLAWMRLKRGCKRGVKKMHCSQLTKRKKPHIFTILDKNQTIILTLTENYCSEIKMMTRHHSWDVSVCRNRCDSLSQ